MQRNRGIEPFKLACSVCGSIRELRLVGLDNESQLDRILMWESLYGNCPTCPDQDPIKAFAEAFNHDKLR